MQENRNKKEEGGPKRKEERRKGTEGRGKTKEKTKMMKKNRAEKGRNENKVGHWDGPKKMKS